MLEIKIWHEENLLSVSLILNSKNKNFDVIKKKLRTEYPHLHVQENSTFDKIPKNVGLDRTVSANKIEYSRGEKITEIAITYGSNLESLLKVENSDQINTIKHHVKFSPIIERPFIKQNIPTDLVTNAGRYIILQGSEEETAIKRKIDRLKEDIEGWENEIKLYKTVNPEKISNIKRRIEEKLQELAVADAEFKTIQNEKLQLAVTQGRHADETIQLSTSELGETYHLDEISFLTEIAELAKENRSELNGHDYACLIKNCLSRSTLPILGDVIKTHFKNKDFLVAVTNYSLIELSEWVGKLQKYTQAANKMKPSDNKEENKVSIAQRNIFKPITMMEDKQLEVISLKVALIQLINNFKNESKHSDAIQRMEKLEKTLNNPELNKITTIINTLGKAGDYAQTAGSDVEAQVLKDMLWLAFNYFSHEEKNAFYKNLKKTTGANPATDVTLSRGQWKDPEGKVETYFINKFILITLNTSKNDCKMKNEVRLI